MSGEDLPSKILVRRISPTTSFFSRRASSKDEQRLMLRRNDSNWRRVVLMVILSVYPAERGLGATCFILRGNWDSKTFRTFEISCLQGIRNCERLYVFRAYCWCMAAPAYKRFIHNPVMRTVDAPLDQSSYSKSRGPLSSPLPEITLCML
jgi:hypothetical protein